MKKYLHAFRGMLPIIVVYSVIAIIPDCLLAWLAMETDHMIIFVYSIALAVCFVFILVREIVLEKYRKF